MRQNISVYTGTEIPIRQANGLSLLRRVACRWAATRIAKPQCRQSDTRPCGCYNRNRALRSPVSCSDRCWLHPNVQPTCFSLPSYCLTSTSASRQEYSARIIAFCNSNIGQPTPFCLQIDWQQTRRRQPDRGIRLPAISKNRTTGKPASALPMADKYELSQVLWRALANSKTDHTRR